MKYLSLPTFDVVTSALNFDTPDCHVTGSCDLYTTKAAGSDKKLYKNIQQSLESQHAALLKLGASLSPPQRDSLAASLNLSRSSPFGSLDEVANRRTFAYLIATLNASHPDYDFSHVLRPADFRRERLLRRAMAQIDSTLTSVRPTSTLPPDVVAASGTLPLPLSSYSNPSGSSSGYHNRSPAGVPPHTTSSSPPPFFFTPASASASPAWGPRMWALVDQEMRLKDCTVFAYQPADDPFAEEEEGAIWALHYFFFNKALKRVCYLYVRGVPVMSSHSPRVGPHLVGLSRRQGSGRAGGVGRFAGGGGLGGGGFGGDEDGMGDDDEDDFGRGAGKRARYWLGDRYAERVTGSDDEMDDGLVWNRDADGDVSCQWDDYDDEEEEEDEGFGEDEEDVEEEEEEPEHDKKRRRSSSPVRGFSEDTAARMEIDV